MAWKFPAMVIAKHWRGSNDSPSDRNYLPVCGNCFEMQAVVMTTAFGVSVLIFHDWFIATAGQQIRQS